MKLNYTRIFGIAALFSLLCLLGVAVQAQDDEASDLSGIKTFLMENTEELKENTTLLYESAQAYYELAEAAEFDYEALWESQPEETAEALLAAKAAWIAASPLYEQVEGIVAGVPVLSEYDVILDAGPSAEEDPENAVPFDLTLPDGRVLEKPGNLFGILEGTLWGTRADFSSGIEADLDDSGEIDFGEILPEANVLLSAAEATDMYTSDLLESADEWEPNEQDAFTALVVMVPTMSEYFGSWKESRFVAGDEATRSDFAVISRLSDIEDILSGLLIVYENVSPRVKEVSPQQNEQIQQGLDELLAYVADLYQQEQDGRLFTAEEADFFGSEAQDRATAITGQIVQVAALLGIEIEE